MQLKFHITLRIYIILRILHFRSSLLFGLATPREKGNNRCLCYSKSTNQLRESERDRVRGGEGEKEGKAERVKGERESEDALLIFLSRVLQRD